MKIRLVAAAVMSITMSATMAAMDATALQTDADKVSYAIGVDLGKNFKKQNIEINPELLAQGFKDASGKPLMADEQMKDVLMKFQKDLMAKRTAEFTKQSEANKAKGDAFLKDNKAKEGVVSLASGLQYKIIKEGTGTKPTKDDTVTVEYTGKLIDGQVFDSTEKTGKPATFKVSQVIPGWTEALQLMPAGSTWEVYVPADLAYGPRSVGGPIGPNETLIFNIHLVSVKKEAA